MAPGVQLEEVWFTTVEDVVQRSFSLVADCAFVVFLKSPSHCVGWSDECVCSGLDGEDC